MRDDDEWQLPVPMEDPEVRGFRPPLAGKGGAGLVPDVDMVEGAAEEDGRTAAPGCPFSH